MSNSGSRQMTHNENCWRWHGHGPCAVRKVEGLAADNERQSEEIEKLTAEIAEKSRRIARLERLSRQLVEACEMIQSRGGRSAIFVPGVVVAACRAELSVPTKEWLPSDRFTKAIDALCKREEQSEQDTK